MPAASRQRRLTDAERDKAESCVRLACRFANDTVNRLGLYGDVAEAVYDKAVDGLLKAATAHDPDKGKMTTYAAYSVRGYIGHALRRAERLAREGPKSYHPNFDRLYPDRGRRWNGNSL
jgi:DNA-directed RNA polymerase specialized sigma subunit